MTPHEFIGVLDDAIAAAKAQRLRRRAIALELLAEAPLRTLAPHIRGRQMGLDPLTGRPVYGFTRRQCEELRALIFHAAGADAAGAPDPTPRKLS